MLSPLVVGIVLVSSTASAFDAAVHGASPTTWWRWPFSPSPYVTINPRDGLPDFSMTGKSTSNFTARSIACPAELQRACCGLSHGDEKCGPKSCKTRPCAGGLYCANFREDVNRSKWMPHFKGSGNTRKAINRTRTNILQVRRSTEV